MVEEIQILPQCQNTTLLYGLFRFLGKTLPEDVEYIAAYAHKMNLHSQAITGKLGMEQAGENGDFNFYRGPFRHLAEKFRKTK